MAQKIITMLTDDLTGEELKTGEGQTVQLGFQGASYELDISDNSLTKLEKALEPYLKVGRRVGGRKQRVRASSSRRDLWAVREWARQKGYEVSDRGRIAASILEAYDAS